MNNLIHKYITGSTAVKIAASIESAVRGGEVAAGAQLPTVRGVARSLKVSPATVASAYQTLQKRGILTSDGRRGTKISQRGMMQTMAPAPLPANVRNLRDGNPDSDLLPDMAGVLREIDPSPRLYGSARNDAELLKIAAKDFATDGIPSTMVSVVNGALDGMERVLREHLRPGDHVAVEDPGFGSIVDLVTSLGLRPVPYTIDDEGPLPDDLARVLRGRVQAVILMPRAQNPTGAALTRERSARIRALFLKYEDVLILEDDHMHLVADAPRMSAIDSKQPRWAVVRSVSKALNPDLRVALLTGDQTTMTRVEDRLVVGERWVSHVLQRIVARLLADKSVRKSLARAADTYASRRNALIDALSEHGIAAHGRSGFNVWIPVPEETPVVQGLLQCGWGVSAGERFRFNSPPAIRMTTSTLQPKEAIEIAADVAKIVRGRLRTASA